MSVEFLLFATCWFCLNAWMTVRVRRAAGLDHRGLHIAMVWITPFLGALFTHWHLRSHGRARDAILAAGDGRLDPPVETICMPGRPPFAFVDHVATAGGFPVVDWPAVEHWLDTLEAGAEREDARLQCHRAWLMHLRSVLGSHFHLHETDHAFVLSSLEGSVARAAARYVWATRTRIRQTLGALAQFPPGHKSVLLVLDDEEWYYHYIGLFYPDHGEFAFSSGIFVGEGCPHFVVRRADLSAIEPVIVHELVHSALARLRLPLWIDEGIAVNAEFRLTAGPFPHAEMKELREQHLRFWGVPEIQQFWAGRSFSRTDEGSKLSYDLARTLVEHFGKTWEEFERFVQHARREDAGASSAQEHLGVDLGACVCALLGKPASDAWSPSTQGVATPHGSGMAHLPDGS
ncbi:hypothetical protein RBH89_21995 [Paracidovorax avenae]